MEFIILYKCICDAVSLLEDNDRLEAYDAIFEYLFNNNVYTGTNKKVEGFMRLAYLHLDKGKKKADKKIGRHCSEYQNWRTAVYNRDSYTCQKCGSKGVELNAHHIRPYATFPELRYDVSNGITLCKSCHKRVHKGEIQI